MADEWSRFATVYDPLKCGSIDGTDTIPHDNGVVRAMSAKYKPNKSVVGDPKCTLFVSRLNPMTTEDTLSDVFSKYGDIKRCRLVKDLVTGASKRYGFVEYFKEKHTIRARDDANSKMIDDEVILVEYENERTMKGWIPRRFGGGLGGKKEAGQLRFGGRDRPFRAPIKQIKNVTRPHGEYNEDREVLARRRGRENSSRDSGFRRDDRDRHRYRSRSRERSDR